MAQGLEPANALPSQPRRPEEARAGGPRPGRPRPSFLLRGFAPWNIRHSAPTDRVAGRISRSAAQRQRSPETRLHVPDQARGGSSLSIIRFGRAGDLRCLEVVTQRVNPSAASSTEESSGRVRRRARATLAACRSARAMRKVSSSTMASLRRGIPPTKTLVDGGYRLVVYDRLTTGVDSVATGAPQPLPRSTSRMTSSGSLRAPASASLGSLMHLDDGQGSNLER
jgi:hypothetical protein